MILSDYPQATKTERLLFRKLYIDDMLPWQTFLANEACTAYYPQHMRNNPVDGALKWMEKQICRYRDGKGGLMAVIEKDSGKFIGQCGLIIQEVDDQPELEVGYHFLPEYWGMGYATEAAIAMKKLGFSISKVDRIISIIQKDNLASQHVARRNGMNVLKETVWNTLHVKIYGIYR